MRERSFEELQFVSDFRGYWLFSIANAAPMASPKQPNKSIIPGVGGGCGE